MDNQIEIKIVGNKLHLYDRLDACWYEFYCKYTSSLDALVPVWEKLYSVFNYETLLIDLLGEARVSKTDSCKTIQEEAAHCTAKAIKELGNG
jgi:hypothetical protein